MSSSVTPHIVVGIDGSPESDAALRFAHEEARLRGASLRIVCAWAASDTAYIGEAFAPTVDVFLAAEHHAEEILRAALERLAPDPAVGVEAVSVEGHPATVLSEQSSGAELLVVGSRGRGATASLVLGSVSQGVAHHTRCPIVIVPHRKG
jgi:nucleotide-binding universal stress UspA family protein